MVSIVVHHGGGVSRKNREKIQFGVGACGKLNTSERRQKMSAELLCPTFEWNSTNHSIIMSGINPERCEDHEAYMNKLCSDYEQSVKQMFDSARQDIDNGNTELDELVTEVMQHTKICQDNCQVFYGIEDALNVRFVDLIWAALCEKVPNVLSHSHTKRMMDFLDFFFKSF